MKWMHFSFKEGKTGVPTGLVLLIKKAFWSVMFLTVLWKEYIQLWKHPEVNQNRCVCWFCKSKFASGFYSCCWIARPGLCSLFLANALPSSQWSFGEKSDIPPLETTLMKKNTEKYCSLESRWKHGASISKDTILSTSLAKSVIVLQICRGNSPTLYRVWCSESWRKCFSTLTQWGYIWYSAVVPNMLRYCLGLLMLNFL